MKIGIVSLGNDSLELFRFLHRYDCEYYVYFDSQSRPLGEKDADTAMILVEQGAAALLARGVDFLVLPPLWELCLLKKYPDYPIIPLFGKYLTHCFGHSLVGKLGVLVEPMNIAVDGGISPAQKLIDEVAASYSLTSSQAQMKSFHQPFAYWTQDVRMWPLLLRSLQPRSFMINTLVKGDLRVFRDAAVDTIIPTNYAYFAMEKTIQRFFNQKKQKFHGMDVLESLWQKLFSEKKLTLTGAYQVTVLSRGRKEMLLGKKRYMWLLERGKSVPVVWEDVG